MKIKIVLNKNTKIGLKFQKIFIESTKIGLITVRSFAEFFFRRHPLYFHWRISGPNSGIFDFKHWRTFWTLARLQRFESCSRNLFSLQMRWKKNLLSKIQGFDDWKLFYEIKARRNFKLLCEEIVISEFLNSWIHNFLNSWIHNLLNSFIYLGRSRPI